MAKITSALDVAKYLLHRANLDGELITNLKMQKLLYYAQAWYLVNFGTELFKDKIEAWTFGPTVVGVYHCYKRFGYAPIRYADNEKIEEKFSTTAKEFLDEFYNIYIRYSAFDLTQMSHNDDPWKEAFNSQDKTIKTETIKEFYTKKYQELHGKKA